MFRVLKQATKYELILLMRNKGDWIPVLLLFSLTIVLFGFSLSQEKTLLSQASPTIIWVAILFSMLSLSELTFRKDLEEGWLSQIRLSGNPLWLFVYSKALAFWALLSFSFVVLLPISILWLYLEPNLILPVLFIYFITTPALIFIMLLGVALTIGLPQPGLLLGLLLLPLYIPILILGQSATAALQYHNWPAFECAMLAAVSIVCIIFAPFLIGLTLQQTSEQSC